MSLFALTKIVYRLCKRTIPFLHQPQHTFSVHKRGYVYGLNIKISSLIKQLFIYEGVNIRIRAWEISKRRKSCFKHGTLGETGEYIWNSLVIWELFTGTVVLLMLFLSLSFIPVLKCLPARCPHILALCTRKQSNTLHLNSLVPQTLAILPL